MPKTTINSSAIRTLAELLEETGLNEIEYDMDGLRIRVARAAGSVAAVAPAPAASLAAPTPAASTEAAAQPSGNDQAADMAAHPGAVTSPMVGTIYLAPEPGAANFAGVGDRVTEGQTLMLIEAMKTFNEIKAPRAGSVAQLLVENAQPVEYGDVLLILE